MSATSINPLRLRNANAAPLNGAGEYVLYWMIAFRRLGHNFALQRAVEIARDLQKPLVILEALRCDYPWASDRLHQFVIAGMAEHAATLEEFGARGVLYYPYVEPQRRAGAGLLAAFAKQACVVVSDDYPCFFLPQMIAAAAERLPARLELVDSNGLVPLRGTDRVFTMAFHFRRWLQKHLPAWLSKEQFPAANPLARLQLPPLRKLPREITQRWPPTAVQSLLARGLGELPLDHSVTSVACPGGTRAARRRLQRFLSNHLGHYEELRNQPDSEVTSGLSPYLHFGQLSAHEVFQAVARHEDWALDCLSREATGQREHWWGCSPSAEAFLDQLVTWRELGFNFCAHRPDYADYGSLPEWCRKTLAKHAPDRRPQQYDLQTLETAQTYDPLWNAAQRQLLREGYIHNYLRMLWGKKVIEWSQTPEEALEHLLHLNNKYALDGRDPNSYSGIFWCFGRYDRPWAPERPIFGQVRYMSSENTARKLRLKEYLRRFGPE